MQKVDIEEGVSGDFRIEKFSISLRDIMVTSRLYRGREVFPGTYTKLMLNNQIIMSDTTAEMNDHIVPVEKARGNILINGLGLGMVLLNCLLKPEVKHTTVIELSKDVIKLVSSPYEKMFKDRLTIIWANAFNYKPKIKYDMVWHDIWPEIKSSNYKQMKKLHYKYSKHAVWQGSWCRDEVIEMKSIEANYKRRR